MRVTSSTTVLPALRVDLLGSLFLYLHLGSPGSLLICTLVPFLFISTLYSNFNSASFLPALSSLGLNKSTRLPRVKMSLTAANSEVEGWYDLQSRSMPA